MLEISEEEDLVLVPNPDESLLSKYVNGMLPPTEHDRVTAFIEHNRGWKEKAIELLRRKPSWRL